ncbi:MAG: carboxylesterase family protein [Chitinophagales bacterium]|nr:carboxylesterase family protein [Chitinophagales bacterium]
MKVTFLLFFILSVFINDSRAQIPGLFLDSIYAYHRIPDIQYGSAYNFQKDVQEKLLLDIYEPSASTDYQRPVLIYVHGGGFTSGSKGGPADIPVFAQYFAPRGWVVASIDYRLGVEDASTTADNYEEAYEATQDAKAAIRYFRRYAQDYCVDTSAIFMTGISAGGATALTCAYWDPEEANPIIDEQKLGLIDEGSGNLGYSSHLTAIVNCWGGINDTSWMKNNDIPQYLFHGTADSTVPYHSGYNSNQIYLYGSYDIHQAAMRYSIESNLHPFFGFGHGIPNESPQMDTVLMLSSKFFYNHFDTRLLTQEECNLTTGISYPENPEQPQLKMLPNAAEGSFTVENLSPKSPFKGVLNVYNLSAQMIYTKPISINAASILKVSLTFIENGIYYVQFKNNSESITEKLIFVH